MRLGIIADIHGNYEALCSFMGLLANRGFDRLVVGGDIVGYGADPNACLELLSHHDPVSVAGNHDWAVVGKIETGYFNDLARRALDWTISRLSDRELNYLETLPLETVIEDIHVVHANPVDPGSWEYLIRHDDIRRICHGLAGIHIVGHSHVPFFCARDPDVERFDSAPGRYALRPDISCVINVGSIGQPRDGIPLSSGVLIDTDEEYVELLREPYPIDATAAKILRESKLPDYLAYRLYTGS